jgi:hypothetical protein
MWNLVPRRKVWFVCSLFNSAFFNNSDFAATMEKTVSGWTNGKDVKGSGRRLILGTIPTSAGENEKKHEILSQDSRTQGQDLNPWTPEYRVWMLTTRRRRLI